MFLWFSIIYNTSKPWFPSAYLYPCLHTCICPSDCEVRNTRWVFKSCIPKEVISKNYPISNGYLLILPLEFSHTGSRVSQVWDYIKLNNEGPQHANKTSALPNIFLQPPKCSERLKFTHMALLNCCKHLQCVAEMPAEEPKISTKLCSFEDL